MRNIEISLFDTERFDEFEPVLELIFAESGLTIALKTTLKQYPGSSHWHVKCGKQKGTLEITLWPKQRRLWLSVHENRAGRWIEGEIDRLKTRIENPA